jgi:hypothetical protein
MDENVMDEVELLLLLSDDHNDRQSLDTLDTMDDAKDDFQGVADNTVLD